MKNLDLGAIPKPAGHRVLIKPDEIEEVSKGGIVLHTTNKDREADAQISGTLVAVGPNAWKAFDDGVPWAKVGDKVLFAKYGGYPLKIKGEMYRVMNDEDITAIVQEADHG
jgi:chaperonin GroES